MSAARQPRPSSPDPGRCRDDRRGGGPRRGPAEPGRRRRGRRRARRRRPAARPVLDAGQRRRGDAGRRRHRRRPQRHPALGRPRAGPGGAGACSRRPSSASGRRSPTASTTTSTCRARSPRRIWRRWRSGCARSSRKASCSRGASTSPKMQAREELANEPYKLELVDDKSGDPEVMEVGGDELTAYDNLNPRTRERVWGDLCRGPHIPTTQVHSGVQADPQLGRVLAGRPEQRQPAAHLRHRVGVAGGARDAPRVDRGGAAPRSPQARRRARPVQLPRRNRFRAWRFSTPRVASCAASWRTTRGASTSRPATSSSTARTSPRRSCSRSPGTWTGTPTACSRRCTSTPNTTRTARCASPGRTTTSSR